MCAQLWDESGGQEVVREAGRDMARERERLVFRKQSYMLLKGRGPMQPQDLGITEDS